MHHEAGPGLQPGPGANFHQTLGLMPDGADLVALLQAQRAQDVEVQDPQPGRAMDLAANGKHHFHMGHGRQDGLAIHPMPRQEGLRLQAQEVAPFPTPRREARAQQRMQRRAAM